MVTSLRRRRRYVASLLLGAWLFGLFVGIAHACGLLSSAPVLQHPVAAGAVEGNASPDAPPGCEKFCNDDLPLLTKIQSVQDSPIGQPMVSIAHHVVPLAPIPRLAFDSSPAAHPATDVPLSIRFLRLTL